MNQRTNKILPPCQYSMKSTKVDGLPKLTHTFPARQYKKQLILSGIPIGLMTADKEVLPEKVTTQKTGIKNLKMDWSRFIDEQGNQLQTAGHHFKLSDPLDAETRSKLDRYGVCYQKIRREQQ